MTSIFDGHTKLHMPHSMQSMMLSGQAHVTLLHHGVKVHESFWSQGGMELQWEKEEDQNAENRKRGLS